MGTERKAGYLEKLGGSFGTTWQKRYFVLNSSTLLWYKKIHETNPRGSLLLENVVVKFNPLKPLLINIPTTKKDYQLKATTSSEIHEWLEAIKEIGGIIEETEATPTKRKSLLSGLKQNKHVRKRSVSESNLFKDIHIDEKNPTSVNSTPKIMPSIPSGKVNSIANGMEQNKAQKQNSVPYPSRSMENSVNSIESGNHIQHNNNNRNEDNVNNVQRLRHATLYDLHLKPIDPFSPVILPSNQFENHLYATCSDELSSLRDDPESQQFTSTNNSFNETTPLARVPSNIDSFDESGSEFTVQIPVVVEYIDPEIELDCY